MDFLNSYDEDEEEFEEKKEEFSIPFGLPTKFGGQQSTTTKIQPNTIFDNDDEKNEIVDQEFNENESDANIYEDYDDNKDDHDFSHHSDGNVADDTDSFAVEHKIPVSHQVRNTNIFQNINKIY